MPWIKSETGLPKWEPPSQEAIDTFVESLNEVREIGQVDVSQFVQEQVASLVSKTLEGSKKLSESNDKLLKSLNNLTKYEILTVDIILPIYNNLQVVKPCIEALMERTNWDFHLVLVDDGSEQQTIDYLDEVWAKYPNVTLLKNKKNKGFCATVNRGMRESNNPFICILNSDVIVTENWLTKMVMALLADDRNKIVNPVTNNTAEIAVSMQAGYSYLDMNRALEKFSARAYPEIMPTGFCFMFKRELVDTIGYFDEGFESYGEETDFWMKTITRVEDGQYPRWRAVLADDTYIFHERGASFGSLGTEKHIGLRRKGSERFHSIWPEYKQWRSTFQIDQILKTLRMELPSEALANPANKYNIAFVVHSAALCGGMSVIADIVNELNERGASAKVVVINRGDKPSPVIHTLRSAPIFFNSVEDAVSLFKDLVFRNGIVIAGTGELVPIVKSICDGKSNLNDLLFAQSLDSELTNDPEIAKLMNENVKSMSGKIVTNSRWLDEYFNKELKTKTLGFVCPGADENIFYPRDREAGDDRKTVLFSLLQTYTHKGYTRGVQVAKTLSNLAKRNKKQIRIMAYGVVNVPECPDIIGLGDVLPAKLANLLGNEIDIFCDPAHIHTYGLPSLEAMMSGVVPVTWDNHGINEYKNNGVVVLPKEASPEKVANDIYSLLFDNKELEKKKEEVKKVNHIRKEAVNEFIEVLEKNFSLQDPKRKIAVITPHLRKHGGPTTILHTANQLKKAGHEVDLVTIYPDINPEVIEPCDTPLIVDWKGLGEYDIVISNSDNPHNDFFVAHPKINKKIMLKLSHNPRFQQLENNSLKLPWDNIITSTEWLKEVCLNPSKEEGWNYGPKNATRVGWFHYGHQVFSCPPSERQYGDLKNHITIGGLAHHHSLKGTEESIEVMYRLKQRFQDNILMGMVGEWPEFKQSKPDWIQYFFNLNRTAMAQLFKQLDIWVCTSQSEGLGRLLLENMSSSVAVVTYDTGAEFAKHEENCLIVNSQSEMINAVVRLLKDHDLRMSICAKAHETAAQYADATEYRQNLGKAIKEVYA